MIFEKDIQVVVLMGGLGTRLKDITVNTPKPMIDIHGKPFFYYQLELMKWYGFERFLFCVGYKGSIVEEYFRDGKKFGVSIEYSYDGSKLLGTAGAIRRAINKLDEDFLLIYGDSYMDVDYHEILYDYFTLKEIDNKKSLMVVFKNRNSLDKSNVIYRENKLLKYDKKNTSPQMEYIDYGISVLSRSAIEAIPEEEFVDLADIYTILVDKWLMAGHVVKNRFYEIGTPTSLAEFKNYIHDRLLVSQKAVFVDRDGTLNEIVFNEDTELLDSPLDSKQLKLFPKTVEALKILKSMDYLLIIVTNQPAAAKGKVRLGKLFEVNNSLRDILAENDIIIDDILMCAHFPQYREGLEESFLLKDCECRKPKPGLLKRAMDKFNIDRDGSYMAGDSHVDILAGESAGLKTVFLGKYKCDTCQLLGNNKPTHTFKNLYDFSLFLKSINEKQEGKK